VLDRWLECSLEFLRDQNDLHHDLSLTTIFRYDDDDDGGGGGGSGDDDHYEDDDDDDDGNEDDDFGW